MQSKRGEKMRNYGGERRTAVGPKSPRQVNRGRMIEMKLKGERGEAELIGQG